MDTLRPQKEKNGQIQASLLRSGTDHKYHFFVVGHLQLESSQRRTKFDVFLLEIGFFHLRLGEFLGSFGPRTLRSFVVSVSSDSVVGDFVRG